MSKIGCSDTELLDFLQALNDRNSDTGQCLLTISEIDGRWKLGESNIPGWKNVRRAILDFMEENKENEKKIQQKESLKKSTD